MISWHINATLGGANLIPGANLHPGVKIHPCANCAHEHGLKLNETHRVFATVLLLQ